MMEVEKIRSPERKEPEVQVTEHQNLAPWEQGAAFAVVGKPHPRVEGFAKVTGSAEYTYDVRLPRQLYAKVLRSPYPHARIRSIDTSRAEALNGVHAVLSSANCREIPWYEDSFVFDPHLRFIGEEVAAVAAESEEIAEDALRLIEVEYEPLPYVTDMDAALLPDTVELHEGGNIAGEPKEYSRGDIEAGFADADVVVEHVYTTHTALHNSLEPHGATAVWEGDKLTLWSSTQSIFTVRQEIAEKLGTPEHNVRVIKQYMGGGFGAKQIAWKSDAIAALLAKQAGRPVQLMLDREAENLAAGNRNPTRQRVRIGAKRDGTLTAIQAEILQAAGAHQAGGEASNVAGTYHTLYQCPNVATKQTAVHINTGPAIAFRAPGFVEGAFALESAMDELAHTLEIDPIELRRRNYTERDQEGDKPYSTPDALRRCYETVERAFGWQTGQQPVANGSTRRGVGFAAHDWVGGAGSAPGYAWVKLNADGTVDVVTGTQDIGTGTRTGLAQIAAEELGLPMDDITLHLGDTAYGPYSPVSSGSATQATIGPAIRAAALDAKEQLLDAAAQIMEASVDDLSIRDGRIQVAGSPERAVPVSDITGQIAPHMIQGRGSRGPNPEEYTIHTFGAQCVEVEVDVETGQVTLLRIVTTHDAGRIINPTMVDAQVVGGITQGLGFALTEGQVLDHRLGLVLNPNLEEYKVPTVADVPEIEHARLDLPDLIANPTGAKGVGEPPLIPTAPAIANAIFHATGIRLTDTPFSRERLLGLLAGQTDTVEGAAQ
jgi:xanthine dehydrogenase YagR molybdenum-binding subunit